MSRPDKNVLVDLWLLSLLAGRLVGDLLEDSPLSVDEFALYGLIVDLGPLTAADLTRATGLSPTTVSGMLGRLTERGEITRVDNPDDRRSKLLAPTERGMEVYLEAVPALISLLDELDRRLGASPVRIREGLEILDGAIRDVLGIDSRPYRVTPPADDTSLSYLGRRLTPGQEREVVAFIDWVRHRDSVG